jgi:thioredoxin 1
MLEINDENFDKILTLHNVLVVDFWATWCRPCKMFSPILEEISKENNIWIAKIDVDQNPIQSSKYNITSVPTTIIFENGKEVKKILGAKPKHQMIEELSKWL